MRERSMRMQAASALDDDEPRRARAGFGRALARAVRRHPSAILGYGIALAFVLAVVVNALFLQASPHPAPFVSGTAHGSAARETTGSLPPAPARASASRTQAGETGSPRAQLITAIQQELAARGFYDGAIDGIYGPRMDAGIREFEQAARLPVKGEPSEALLAAIRRSKLQAARRQVVPQPTPVSRQEARPVPTPPSRRVIAIQRALSDFGYGQLRLTGVFDDATKAAIEKFERERKLPVRGQISDRLIRELAAVTGRPLE